MTDATKDERSMKVKAVRYGRVIPARDGTPYSTERIEVEVEATVRQDTPEDLLAAAVLLVNDALKEGGKLDEFDKELAEGDDD